ncbi:MAG: transketolase [Candidatus Spechtbacteria bacterium SB0662_bin_43]|uniref:Transketolase n=1 Tax=Candidatus Spechtbacteria bacterium SB0662_bin_43 TaxID=2604897 RepID=A0A845D9F1_9BACT|nr:transketolase [Candidatus Spechtbacteria bacterium SB0662_bin_43]
MPIPPIHNDKVKVLEKKAIEIREDILQSLYEAGSGHSAGPLGMADVFTALYFHILNHKPQNPYWEDRDRMVLSNGHIVPGQYVTLAHAGYLPIEELKSLRKLGTRLQGHPHRPALPGIETTSGPLGSGLGQASGMAWSALLDGKKWRVYCVMSDGEQDAGNTWEAAMWAGKHRLHNLTAVMDRNNIQIDGYTEDVMPLEPLKEKYEAFNWKVLEIDGHNIGEIVRAYKEAEAIFEKPVLIIANTIPGWGVEFMENKYEWHGKPPSSLKELKEALDDLRTLEGRIESEHR